MTRVDGRVGEPPHSQTIHAARLTVCHAGRSLTTDDEGCSVFVFHFASRPTEDAHVFVGNRCRTNAEKKSGVQHDRGGTGDRTHLRERFCPIAGSPLSMARLTNGSCSSTPRTRPSASCCTTWYRIECRMPRPPGRSHEDHGHGQGRGHSHSHGHSQGQSHSHSHSHSHSQGQGQCHGYDRRGPWGHDQPSGMVGVVMPQVLAVVSLHLGALDDCQHVLRQGERTSICSSVTAHAATP